MKLLLHVSDNGRWVPALRNALDCYAPSGKMARIGGSSHWAVVSGNAASGRRGRLGASAKRGFQACGLLWLTSRKTRRRC